MNGLSPALLATAAASLHRLFPEMVSDGKVDFERLRAFLEAS
jgi:hypothetical protein